jgi:hypothetical protein
MKAAMEATLDEEHGRVEEVAGNDNVYDEIGEKSMNVVYCIVLSSGRASLLPHALKLGAPQLGLFSTVYTFGRI